MLPSEAGIYRFTHRSPHAQSTVLAKLIVTQPNWAAPKQRLPSSICGAHPILTSCLLTIKAAGQDYPPPRNRKPRQIPFGTMEYVPGSSSNYQQAHCTPNRPCLACSSEVSASGAPSHTSTSRRKARPTTPPPERKSPRFGGAGAVAQKTHLKF